MDLLARLTRPPYERPGAAIPGWRRPVAEVARIERGARGFVLRRSFVVGSRYAILPSSSRCGSWASRSTTPAS